MNRINSNSQPMSTTMVETSSVTSSSMFLTSLKTHFYGGSSVPTSYQPLFGAFSGVASGPWASPMSSNSKIMSGTSLMNSTLPAPLPPPTPTIELQDGPYVSGKSYPQ